MTSPARGAIGYCPGPAGAFAEANAVLRRLVPGAHVALATSASFVPDAGAFLRLRGLEVRDTLPWIRPLSAGGNHVVLLARVPLTGTVVDTVTVHGAGALNVDACRLGPGDLWPVNVVVSHVEQCAELDGAWTCVDHCPAASLDRQSGVFTSVMGKAHSSIARGGMSFIPAPKSVPGVNQYGDSGGASRFFVQLPAGWGPLASWLARLIGPPRGQVVNLFTGQVHEGETTTTVGVN